MKSLDELLDDLAAYVDTPETSCFSLPPDAYLSPELNALEVRAIFERSWLCVLSRSSPGRPHLHP